MKYAGDILSTDAYEILKNEKNSFLIDVRSAGEWEFSGMPDLSTIGKETLPVSWIFFPQMELNNDFAKAVEEKIPNRKAKLFFLCKSGGRSLNAAIKMTEQGYENCYNISGGFEGMNMAEKIIGWKAEMLPWCKNI